MSTKRVSKRVTPAKNPTESKKNNKSINSLAKNFIQIQTDFSMGVLREDTEKVFNQLNTKLKMKIDAKKISFNLFNSSASLDFQVLLKIIFEIISNMREKLELHFFVPAKILNKTKKNTM